LSAALVATLLLAGCDFDSQDTAIGSSATPVSQLEGVARVLDGDTIELAGERVRLWGG
jgi:endonuclease YncB( thermonuclease family)